MKFLFSRFIASKGELSITYTNQREADRSLIFFMTDALESNYALLHTRCPAACTTPTQHPLHTDSEIYRETKSDM